MKNVLIAAMTAVLLGGIAAAPAFAEGPKTNSENNWPGMSAPVEPMAAPIPAPMASAPAAAPGAHWEWQVTYAHGGKARGEWVLVP